MIDHQVGLSTFLTSIDPALLKNNILGHAKTAKAFDIPTILGTSWPQGPNGPTIPELIELFGKDAIIDRPFVNFWNDEASKKAVTDTGRKKLVLSGLATEVCVAFPAIAAVQEGYEVYAVIDASADWNPLVTEITMKRLASAGVVVTTWVAVLAELANNTQKNGMHIANILSEHMGQYSVAMSNYLGVAKNAEMMREQIGTPPLQAHL
ncbi:MAG: isochorismatase family protein [Leeuwenhoekiella sp.]